MNAKIGDWTRVEGTPNDPNPNKPFTKTENYPLFNDQGKLNPSITIGKNYALKLCVQFTLNTGCFWDVSNSQYWMEYYPNQFYTFFSIVGCHVTIPSEVILLNSVVLPNKQLRHSIKNEIVL